MRPAGRGDGLIARDEQRQSAVLRHQARRRCDNALAADVAPALIGEFALADGRKARPVFELMAERYLDAKYAPEAVAEQIGMPAATIRRIAAELADAAFEQQIEITAELDRLGRPASTTASSAARSACMRCAASRAHSNGFHTCRAIHLLQMLLGTIDCPGGFRYKPPFPRPARRRSGRAAAAQVGPMHAAAGTAARLPAGAGGSADRARRHAAPHRQGLLLGGAARRSTA